jgi:hypothetical protein
MFTFFLVLLALTAFFNLAEMALVAARASMLVSRQRCREEQRLDNIVNRLLARHDISSVHLLLKRSFRGVPVGAGIGGDIARDGFEDVS